MPPKCFHELLTFEAGTHDWVGLLLDAKPYVISTRAKRCTAGNTSSYSFSAVCILSTLEQHCREVEQVKGTRTSKKITFWLCFVLAITSSGYCQSNSTGSIIEPSNVRSAKFQDRTSDQADSGKLSSFGDAEPVGWLVRGLRRTLEDQKEIYVAPFRPANLKWDALALLGTAAFIATDRQTSRALPTGHDRVYRDSTNAGIALIGGSVGGIWIYGLKKPNEHAKETGELALETLVNTFLVYTPLQFIAGRERPEEGTGNGRFLQNHGFNTSFPSGHAMFGWSMATIVAHEYPKTWVKILAYTAATSASVGRFMGREHFPSDVFVGSVLGYAIATHIFHVRCDPSRSDACPR